MPGRNREAAKELNKLFKEQKELNDRIQLKTAEAFPVGAIVEFKRGRGYVVAEILRYGHHGTQTSVFIESQTGKRYSVYLFWLMGK